jgi:hypothetical protein
MLQSGALTQLEWIDRCAVELRVDGVEFGAAHFPRTDGDYLAQLKKLCVDRGLTAASVFVDFPFGQRDVDRQVDELGEWTKRAIALGSPLVHLTCGAAEGSPGIAWRELVRALKMACEAAKDRNVTLALEAKDQTLVATPADAKRVLKECDSAWLRLAPTTAQLSGPVAPEWLDLFDAAVLVATDGRVDNGAASALKDRGYIGFASLGFSGEDEETAVPRAIAALRRVL